MRSWQALSVLVVLIGWPAAVEAETSPDRRPLVIPETAPVPPPNSPPRIIYCGSGLISAEEYEEWWSYWRAIALSAEGPAQRECRAFALIELAELPSRRAFGHFGAPYWRAAVETLEDALPEDDPRLAGVRLRYAESGGLPAQERERSIRSSLRALEAAAARPGEVPDLGCSFLRETGVWFSKLSGELRAATPTDRRKLLSRAHLALLRLLVETGRTDEALAVARAAQRHLARRLELDPSRDQTFSLNFDVSILVQLLERLPSGRVPERQLVEAIELLRRVEPRPQRYGGSTAALHTLAKHQAERRELGHAEATLRRALVLGYEAARAEPRRPDRAPPSVRMPPGAFHKLVEIFELERRWDDLEQLYLDDLAEAEQFDAEAVGSALDRVIGFYRRQERPGEALSHLRHLDRVLPGRWTTRLHHAEIHSDLGRLPEAEAELREAFRLLGTVADPASAGRIRLLEARARIERRAGRIADAETSLAEAVELHETRLARTGSSSERRAIGISKARLLVELGRLDEAEDLYRWAEAAFASKPADFRLARREPLLGRMRIAAARGDAKRALALLEEAAGICSEVLEAGSLHLERCLASAAERAAEASLEGPAADVRRRAEEVTAWARVPAAGTDEAPLPIASRSPR
jgi:tetratricopeptide (TPR) repeat protein